MEEGSVSKIDPQQFLLIIGSMKSATTSLFSLLAEHPEICPSEPKEPEFFSKHQGHRKEIARYEDLWDFDPARHRIAMEGSTGYTKFGERGAAEAIHAYGIRPRLVYMVRNPFDRIESHYNFMRRNPDWRRPITHPDLVQTSNYYLYLKDFGAVFGPENLLLLDYDDFVRDPKQMANDVCAFAGLPEMAEIADASARNVTEKPKSELERTLRRMAPGLVSQSPDFVKRPLRRAMEAIRPDKTRLTPAQRQQITADLAPDMARLQAEFGVDVARWGF